VATTSYPAVKDFQFAFGAYKRAQQLAQQYAAIQEMKAYLDGVTDLGDADLRLSATAIGTQLDFDSLLTSPDKVAAIADQFRQFREKYVLAYRKYHRDYHDGVIGLKATTEPYARKVTAIDRLNQLELGAPVGASLSGEYRRIMDGLEPCADRAYAKVDQQPICPVCRLPGGRKPPKEEAESLQARLDAAVSELLGRVAQGAVRKILEASQDSGVKTLLEVILATQVDRIPDVLLPETIGRIKELLRDANLEHRDIPLRGLLGDRTAVEEHEVDALLDQIRQALKAAFAKAKSETGGKKRIRFFLK
jgi:hypothetical protein